MKQTGKSLWKEGSSGHTRQGFRRRGCRAAHPGAAAPGRRSGWGYEIILSFGKGKVSIWNAILKRTAYSYSHDFAGVQTVEIRQLGAGAEAEQEGERGESLRHDKGK